MFLDKFDASRQKFTTLLGQSRTLFYLRNICLCILGLGQKLRARKGGSLSKKRVFARLGFS